MITKNEQIAINALNNHEVVAIPTETVYGLAGNAYSKTALRKIFKIKKRPLFNPLIVHIKSIEYLENVAIEIPEAAYTLAKHFWPGPLTLVLKKNPKVPNLVTAEKPTVAVRVPNHPATLSLLNSLEFPLAAPSANPFGCISPTSARHVYHYFGEKLKFILDGGECQEGVESTIIGFEKGEPVLYRHGSITMQDIKEKIGELKIAVKNDSTPIAPGMLSKHYAPQTPLYMTNNIDETIKKFKGKKIGLLLLKEKNDLLVNYNVALSTCGDLREAAKNLYRALHNLDGLKLDVIIAEFFPKEGIGITINDRLKRAAKNEIQN